MALVYLAIVYDLITCLFLQTNYLPVNCDLVFTLMVYNVVTCYNQETYAWFVINLFLRSCNNPS